VYRLDNSIEQPPQKRLKQALSYFLKWWVWPVRSFLRFQQCYFQLSASYGFVSKLWSYIRSRKLPLCNAAKKHGKPWDFGIATINLTKGRHICDLSNNQKMQKLVFFWFHTNSQTVARVSVINRKTHLMQTIVKSTTDSSVWQLNPSNKGGAL
jgi:hypothetical protein